MKQRDCMNSGNIHIQPAYMAVSIVSTPPASEARFDSAWQFGMYAVRQLSSHDSVLGTIDSVDRSPVYVPAHGTTLRATKNAACTIWNLNPPIAAEY